MQLLNSSGIQLKQVSLKIICQQIQIHRRHIRGNQQPTGGTSFRRFLQQRSNTLVELADRIGMTKFMGVDNAMSVLRIPCTTTKGPTGC